jgi:hypothetical protein
MVAQNIKPNVAIITDVCLKHPLLIILQVRRENISRGARQLFTRAPVL